MCGRLVNLDTVARVLADYYHLKTETQLAVLDEALSRVPAVSVVGGYRKDHVVDPNKMVGDLISRAAVVDAIEGVDWYHINKNGEMVHGANDAEHQAWYKADDIYAAIERVPPAQPDVPDTNVGDMISRQAALDAVNSLIDLFERILSDIRESTVDDSVCGMCEYDGAFVGQSGDWCNECPGFEKDNCFKLSDECRKRWFNSVALPSAQQWIPCSERLPEKPGQYYVSGGDKVWICEFLIIPNFIGGWCNDVANPVVQAWMPIPEPWKGDTP